MASRASVSAAEEPASVSPTDSRSTGDEGILSSQRPPPQQRTTSEYRVVRKRNRIPLSCGPCRNRKLKCNRATPCDNCVRRRDVNSCTYATSTAMRARPRERGGQSDEMQARIDRLEGLVLSLMQSGAVPDGGAQEKSERSASTVESLSITTGSVDDEQEQDAEDIMDDGDDMEKVSAALGILKFDGEKTYYRGETYWAAILHEIQGMKKAFLDSKTQIEIEMEKMKHSDYCPPEPTALQRSAPFATALGREELITMVPVKGLVDLLVDAYFRNFDPLFHILHRPTFNQQMEVFYTNRSSVDTSWLALLFAVLSVSLRIYHYSGEEPEALAGQTLPMAYHLRAAGEAALGAAQFVKKPFPHTLQALILLCIFPGQDDKMDYLWPIMAMGIRIAMTMGLHREVVNYQDKELSPRVGEIRRRIWAQLVIKDIVGSMQMGLPAMIHESDYDTAPPLNLRDDEMPETGPLPPSRPNEEMTEASYLIHYRAYITFFARTSAAVQSAGRNFTYAGMKRLESIIAEMRNSLPRFLQFQPLEVCLANQDPVWLILQRYTLDMIYQKTILLLHRPFSSRCTRDRTHIYSARARCVDATMQILSHHATLNSGHPGLVHGRWFLVAQRLNDYLQAVMYLCLYLSMTAHEARQRQQQQSQRMTQIPTPTSTNSPSSTSPRSATSPGRYDPTTDYTHPRESIYSALHGFRASLARSEDTDIETAKARIILGMVFEKLSKDDPDFPECGPAEMGQAAEENNNNDNDNDSGTPAVVEWSRTQPPLPSASTTASNPTAITTTTTTTTATAATPLDPTSISTQIPSTTSAAQVAPQYGFDDIQTYFPMGPSGWEEWDELMRGVEITDPSLTAAVAGWMPPLNAGGPPWFAGGMDGGFFNGDATGSGGQEGM